MFPDEESARKWFENLRWPNGEKHCPRYESKNIKTVPNENPMPYHCGDWRKYFSVRTGTVMRSSKTSLRKWGIAMYLMATMEQPITENTWSVMLPSLREGITSGSLIR